MNSKMFAQITAEDIARIHAEEDICGCCELHEYDEEDFAPCSNCGHSPEEHE